MARSYSGARLGDNQVSIEGGTMFMSTYLIKIIGCIILFALEGTYATRTETSDDSLAFKDKSNGIKASPSAEAQPKPNDVPNQKNLANKDPFEPLYLDDGSFSDLVLASLNDLKTLNLSNNPNFNFKSELFQNLSQQLVSLEVSNCDIDEDDFAIICNFSSLQSLILSNNPNIKFSTQNLKNLKKTVKHLKIDNCDLKIEDMVEICSFEQIEVLDISKNFLSDFFNSDCTLGNLEKTLTRLSAFKVEMGVYGLSKFHQCEKLRYLNISSNNLCKEDRANHLQEKTASKASFNIDKLFSSDLANQLEYLNVSRANLSLEQLGEILDLPNIKILDCSFNNFIRLGNTFDIGLAKKSLREMRLSYCCLKNQTFLQKLLNCRPLRILDLSGNDFYAENYDFIRAHSLKWLNISASKVNIKPFVEMLGRSETLENREMLEYLNISRNVFKSTNTCDVSKSIFGGLKKSLKCLKMFECKIRRDYNFLFSMTDCDNLEYIDVSSNLFGELPEQFHFGSATKTLKHLKMNNCSLSGANTFKLVTDFENLKALELDGNNFAYSGHKFVAGSSKNSIESISMVECKLDHPSILYAISDCKALEKLDMSSNELFYNFENFTFGLARYSLKSIKMSNCKLLSEKLLEKITDCENLSELYLSNNSFSHLSDSFHFGASKNSLVILDMSSCLLSTSKILFEVTDCNRLKKLILSNNDFNNIGKSFSFSSSRNSLKILIMNSCQMSDPNLFKEITSCATLETLSIARNCFSFIKNKYVFGQSKICLKNLNISENYGFAKHEDFHHFFDSLKLEKLDISYIILENIQQGLNFECFGSLKDTLKELKAIGCELSYPSVLQTLTSFPGLKTIDISENYFKSFPENFALGNSKETLQKIVAKYSYFQDKNIIAALSDCKNLESLVLNGNKFRDVKDVRFGVSRFSLRELKLENCNIKFLDWIYEIKQCPKIRMLSLASNNLRSVVDEFDILAANQITHLNLSDCRIEKLDILNSLAKYDRLEYLKMDYNNLSDLSLTFDVGKLIYNLTEFFTLYCKFPSDNNDILLLLIKDITNKIN